MPKPIARSAFLWVRHPYGRGGDSPFSPCGRRVGDEGEAPDREYCLFFLSDLVMSFDSSKQKTACPGPVSPCWEESTWRQQVQSLCPVSCKEAADAASFTFSGQGSGQCIGPEGIARICVPRVSIDQGSASARKVLQGSAALVSSMFIDLRAMHRAGSWRGSAAPGGRGRSLSPPRAPGGAGVGPGWG